MWGSGLQMWIKCLETPRPCVCFGAPAVPTPGAGPGSASGHRMSPGMCPKCQGQAGQGQGSGLDPAAPLGSASGAFPSSQAFSTVSQPSPGAALPCQGYFSSRFLFLCRQRAHSSPSIFPVHFSQCNSQPSLLHPKDIDRFVPSIPISASSLGLPMLGTLLVVHI